MANKGERGRQGIADIIIIVVKAILIAAAILFLGSFFGLNVREAGGDAIASTTCVWRTQST
jgi:hypothetical protein